MGSLGYQLFLIIAITMFCLSNLWLLYSFFIRLQERALIRMEELLRGLVEEKQFLESDQDVERDIKKLVFEQAPLQISIFVHPQVIHCHAEFTMLKRLYRKDLIDFTYDRATKQYIEQLSQNGFFDAQPRKQIYYRLSEQFSRKVIHKNWSRI